MADFIIQANIAHYNELLATETDARKVATIRKLLAEEVAKLAGPAVSGTLKGESECPGARPK